jgi:hypothetical protein
MGAGRGRSGTLLAAALLLAAARALPAEVVRVEVVRREAVLDGRPFGAAGAYEKLVGRIYFAFDPENAANARVVDLTLAVRNGQGLVEAWADFAVLQPVDPERRRGVAWLEVVNRGGRASLRYFNRARSSLDPTSEADFGDGLLLREGLTLIWVGWQWDVPDEEGLLRLRTAIVRGSDGRPLEGLARADWTVDEDTETLELGHRGHRPYLPADTASPDHVLTVRAGRDEPREVVPRDRWRFVASDMIGATPAFGAIRLEDGFRAGHIYELAYRARDPRLVGLGLAVVRDVMSYAKYGLHAEFPARTGVAFGVSQTGRFLRHFLHQGFNVDEGGRKVFDGMLIHTAGAGRGSFNHRFAQPSRDAHRYSAFFYPTDLFPFTSRVQSDPFAGREEGLWEAMPAALRPRVMLTNTGYEYWGRAASLVHTSPDGRSDVPPLPEERIYHLAGGQHFVGPFPPDAGSRLPEARAWVGDPVDYLPTLRALALALVAWVRDGTEPPPSRYPTIADGTLVSPAGLAFPVIAGVETPSVVHVAYRADYGPRFVTEGIVDRQPPELGPSFESLVPQVDGFGNELGGVRGVELRAPLATYAPWALRIGLPAPAHELRDFVGTFAPLPLTPESRAAAGDSRPSIQRLHGSREAYLVKVRAAVQQLVDERFLLAEDAERVTRRAGETWDWVTGEAANESPTRGGAGAAGRGAPPPIR